MAQQKRGLPCAVAAGTARALARDAGRVETRLCGAQGAAACAEPHAVRHPLTRVRATERPSAASQEPPGASKWVLCRFTHAASAPQMQVPSARAHSGSNARAQTAPDPHLAAPGRAQPRPRSPRAFAACTAAS